MFVTSAEAWVSGIPWPQLGHLPELYTRMTQNELWPERKILTKTIHLEIL